MPRTVPAPRKQGQLSFRYRILRFVAFNIVFAFVPAGISVGFTLLGDKVASISAFVPDLLFFSVVITATTLGDISDELFRGGTDEGLLAYGLGLLFGLIISAAFYGGYQYGAILGPNNSPFSTRMIPIAIGLSVVLCGVSIAAEVLLARIQEDVTRGTTKKKGGP